MDWFKSAIYQARGLLARPSKRQRIEQAQENASDQDVLHVLKIISPSIMRNSFWQKLDAQDRRSFRLVSKAAHDLSDIVVEKLELRLGNILDRIGWNPSKLRQARSEIDSLPECLLPLTRFPRVTTLTISPISSPFSDMAAAKLLTKAKQACLLQSGGHGAAPSKVVITKWACLSTEFAEALAAALGSSVHQLVISNTPDMRCNEEDYEMSIPTKLSKDFFKHFISNNCLTSIHLFGVELRVDLDNFGLSQVASLTDLSLELCSWHGPLKLSAFTPLTRLTSLTIDCFSRFPSHTDMRLHHLSALTSLRTLTLCDWEPSTEPHLLQGTHQAAADMSDMDDSEVSEDSSDDGNDGNVVDDGDGAPNVELDNQNDGISSDDMGDGHDHAAVPLEHAAHGQQQDNAQPGHAGHAEHGNMQQNGAANHGHAAPATNVLLASIAAVSHALGVLPGLAAAAQAPNHPPPPTNPQLPNNSQPPNTPQPHAPEPTSQLGQQYGQLQQLLQQLPLPDQLQYHHWHYSQWMTWFLQEQAHIEQVLLGVHQVLQDLQQLQHPQLHQQLPELPWLLGHVGQSQSHAQLTVQQLQQLQQLQQQIAAPLGLFQQALQAGQQQPQQPQQQQQQQQQEIGQLQPQIEQAPQVEQQQPPGNAGGVDVDVLGMGVNEDDIPNIAVEVDDMDSEPADGFDAELCPGLQNLSLLVHLTRLDLGPEFVVRDGLFHALTSLTGLTSLAACSIRLDLPPVPEQATAVPGGSSWGGWPSIRLERTTPTALASWLPARPTGITNFCCTVDVTCYDASEWPDIARELLRAAENLAHAGCPPKALVLWANPMYHASVATTALLPVLGPLAQHLESLTIRNLPLQLVVDGMVLSWTLPHLKMLRCSCPMGDAALGALCTLQQLQHLSLGAACEDVTPEGILRYCLDAPKQVKVTVCKEILSVEQKQKLQQAVASLSLCCDNDSTAHE